MLEFLRLESDLRAAEARLDKSVNDRERATFKIAAALLTRAMGGIDRTLADEWKKLADDLSGKPADKDAQLWTWAGLATCLAADGPSRRAGKGCLKFCGPAAGPGGAV